MKQIILFNLLLLPLFVLLCTNNLICITVALIYAIALRMLAGTTKGKKFIVKLIRTTKA